MTKQEIDVSFVMTVYNKEYYLPAVLTALLNQTGLQNPEFIFVDDKSSDSSVNIIREMTKNVPNVTIVAKEKNEGISITINKGISMARGEWVRMLDSDDILPLNSTSVMLQTARKYQAEMIYGEFVKTGKEPMDISKELMSENFKVYYNPNAMDAVLGGHFIRMGQLIRRSVLQKSGGADTKVFVQDESIPLRAAQYAIGAVKIKENVVLVPKETNNLSKNTHQLDNDRFFAYYNYLLDKANELDKKTISLIYLKALSANWKYVKKNLAYPYLRSDFRYYIQAKLWRIKPNFTLLARLADRFLGLTDVLRSHKQI